LSPDPHQEFIELCARATAGDLTAVERSRLNDHLFHCEPCREIAREYELVIAETLPSLAADAFAQRDEEDLSPSWSIERAEQDLMRSLDEIPAPRFSPSIHALASSRPQGVWPFAFAAVILIVLGLASYELGLHRGKRPDVYAGASVAPKIESKGSLVSSEIPPARPAVPAPVDNPRIEELREQERASVENAAALKQRQDLLESELASQAEDLSQSQQERADLSRQLAQSQADSQDLKEKLALRADQKSGDSAALQALSARADNLEKALEGKDKAIAEQQDLLQHDRDIRDLIGARDLYIAEIYDVAKTGDTQKPFGRVFYTKDKSLVFYGYDLDQQRGVKTASVFQAWGRQGSDQRQDVSLGMLYQDDGNNKRWVLKSNDATTLARIDAVFVTVEPKGGSTKPTGKPLLFTYLRINPNHP